MGRRLQSDLSSYKDSHSHGNKEVSICIVLTFTVPMSLLMKGHLKVRAGHEINHG